MALMKPNYTMVLLLFLFMAFLPLNNARLIEDIVIGSSPSLLSETNNTPVSSQQLIFNTSPNSQESPEDNRVFAIGSFSKSRRSPGVGHMQIYSAKGILLSRHSLHGGDSNMEEIIEKRVLRSVPSPGVGN